MKKYLLLLLLLLSMPSAWGAATYTFTSGTYTSTLCMACAGDLTGHHATASFTTPVPLAPNLSGYLVTLGQMSAYSFSDGVSTTLMGDPDIRFDGFSVSTDATGHVTSGGALMFKWLSGTAPHIIGDTYRSFSFDSASLDTNVGNVMTSNGISASDTPTGSTNVAGTSLGTASLATAGGSWASILPAPTVTVISPNSGPLAGGTLVTITGTDFLNGATVTIGGVAATSVTWGSTTSLTATLPAGTAGAKNVVVTNPDTQFGTLSNGYTYVAAPTVTAISPSSGPTAGGMAVTITGTGFINGATVTIGGAAASSVTWVSATSITATTPAGTAGAKNVVVTNPDTQFGTLSNGYTYAAPVVAAPASVPTLSEWGLIALACLMVFSGLAMRRSPKV